jgi:hypothetical protein
MKQSRIISEKRLLFIKPQNSNIKIQTNAPKDASNFGLIPKINAQIPNKKSVAHSYDNRSYCKIVICYLFVF